MARFLKNRYDEYWEQLLSSGLAEEVLLAAADLGPRLSRILRKKKGIRVWYVVCGYTQNRFKSLAANEADWPKGQADSMTRVQASLYVGLEQRDGTNYFSERRTVSVPKYFLSRLEAWNNAREEADKREVALRSRCKTLSTKVYKSRTFPPSLRAIIFERDGHRCCNCGRGKEHLFLCGLHLEVDHKIAWIDGGETSYANGETLCCECNSAKHHTKNVVEVLSLMRNANG